MELIIQLVSGAIGGNVAGGLMSKMSLGPLGNSLAGIVGGGIGGQLLGNGALTAGAGMDMASVLGTVASGGAGGGIVMIAAGLIKTMVAK